MLRRHLIGAACATAVAGLSSAPAVAQPPMPYAPVPAPRHEAVPPARTGYYWQPGSWDWAVDRYVWHNGHWIVGGPHYGHFLPGQWSWNGTRWVWIPAHWG